MSAGQKNCGRFAAADPAAGGGAGVGAGWLGELDEVGEEGGAVAVGAD
jgi:hypothetical protein